MPEQVSLDATRRNVCFLLYSIQYEVRSIQSFKRVPKYLFRALV